MTQSLTVDSPLGPLTITAKDQAITSVVIGPDHSEPSSPRSSNPVLQRAADQLAEYFAGQRTHFDLPIAWEGTAFQRAIWTQLRSIPFGASVTYQELGEAAGVGTAARAVGGAVGKNPIPIIVPCHRVLGASKKITGYSGGEGIPTKELLLTLEAIAYR